MTEKFNEKKNVPLSLGYQRFDQIAVQCFPEFSRSKLQQWIKNGQLLVDGKIRKAKEKLTGGELLTLDITLKNHDEWLKEDIFLNCIYEDNDLLVINKNNNIIVHPGAGNYNNTLLNGIVYHYPEMASLPRAGIVHRLDKNTTGLMVIAKNIIAQNHLVKQLQERTVSRQYETIVKGVLISGGSVNKPLGRHPRNKLKMAVIENGKPSITHYQFIKKFQYYTHVRCLLETGRTHQIRVHLNHIGYPIVGDNIYNGKMHPPKSCSKKLQECLLSFDRQALHAKKLSLVHPTKNIQMTWEIDLPEDMKNLLHLLEENEMLN